MRIVARLRFLAARSIPSIPATSRSRRPRKNAFTLTPFTSCPPRARRISTSPRLRRSSIATRWSRSAAPITRYLHPSLAEAPDGVAPHVFYTIDTVRRFKREHPDDHLYFIVGADQFLEIPTWKNYEALLDSCDFVIASRPGFRLDALRLIIPPEKLGRTKIDDPQKIVLRKSVIHLLTTVSSHISSTEIRQRLDRHQNIHGLVPAPVEEYILGQALYR